MKFGVELLQHEIKEATSKPTDTTANVDLYRESGHG